MHPLELDSAPSPLHLFDGSVQSLTTLDQTFDGNVQSPTINSLMIKSLTNKAFDPTNPTCLGGGGGGGVLLEYAEFQGMGQLQCLEVCSAGYSFAVNIIIFVIYYLILCLLVSGILLFTIIISPRSEGRIFTWGCWGSA